MYISKFQVCSYKSFDDSGIIQFLPGFNIIIGPNNAGKTALLESLALSFENKPHLSEKVLPPQHETQPNLEGSKVNVTISIPGSEIVKVYNRLEKPVTMAAPIDDREAGRVINDRFREGVDIEVSLGANSQYPDKPHLNLYSPLMSNGQYTYTGLTMGTDDLFHLTHIPNPPNTPEGMSLNFRVLNQFKKKIYRFVASRVIDNCPIKNSDQLKPNAANLADVLLRLSTREPHQYKLFNEDVTKVFPETKWVYAEMLDTTTDTASIYISPIEPTKQRRDLAFALSEYGTGVGQVLAILYILHTAREPKVLIIDEPQSFLHPRAVKTLIEILKKHPQHQYFIATHSPVVISSTEPSTIMVLTYKEGITSMKELNSHSLDELKELLTELGVEISDIFGADNILWVEGPSESNCFPIILKKYTKYTLRDIRIFPHDNIGDLESKKKEELAKKIFKLHSIISNWSTLYTSKVHFIWDMEDRSKEDMDGLAKRCGNLLKFLPRRMFENYLINERGIAELINSYWLPDSDFSKVSESDVKTKLNELLAKKDYFAPLTKIEDRSEPNWLVNIDGSSLLDDVLNELTNKCLEYKKNKPDRSLRLTKLLISSEDENELGKLGKFIEGVLAG